MKKIGACLLLLILAMPIAGIFGALHDQVSFTVSPEYFTRFKFPMFRLLDASVTERIRAAEVGFLACWWMGIPIGLSVAPLALIHRSPRTVLRIGLWAYGLLVAFTTLFALGGLAYGYLQTRTIDLSAYRGWYLPANLIHLRRFLCVGYMHNSSYLGGIAGILVAWTFLIVTRLRSATDPPPDPAHTSGTPRAAA